MKIKYSNEADILLIEFKEGTPVDSIDLKEGIVLHMDSKGVPIEMEIFDASDIVSMGRGSGFPYWRYCSGRVLEDGFFWHGFHGLHGWFSVRLGSEVGDLVCMFIEKAIRFAYQVGNRFPGLIKGIQALLPGSVEERITDMILRGEGGSGDRKLVFRDGRYENRVEGKGLKAGCNIIGFVFGEFGIGGAFAVCGAVLSCGRGSFFFGEG